MINSKESDLQFPLQDGDIEITLMETKDVTLEYVSWLNDKNHVRYSNQRFVEHSLESCIKYVESFYSSPDILFKISFQNHFVGTSSLEIDNFNRVGVLGMLISPQFKNRGIGEKAWCAIISKVAPSVGLRKVKAGVAKTNFAMKEIILRSGMTLEGVLVRDLVIDNSLCDLELYCIFLVNDSESCRNCQELH